MSLSGRERGEGFLAVCGVGKDYSRERGEGFLGGSGLPASPPNPGPTVGHFTRRTLNWSVKEYERKQLLERIQREAATVGADIPETIEVQGESVDLQEFVFEIRRRDTVPPGERERVERAKKNLRRERLQRKQRLEEADVSKAEGEEMVADIVGIDRALNALEQLGTVDIEAEAKRSQAADTKRWMEFLKKALGHADDDAGIGAGRGR